MTLMTTSLAHFDGATDRMEAFVQRNSSAIVLGCMLSAAMMVWLAPAAPESRCMLVQSRAFTVQHALSLSIALTALVWRFHKPALHFAARLRGKESDAPSQ